MERCAARARDERDGLPGQTARAKSTYIDGGRNAEEFKRGSDRRSVEIEGIGGRM